MNHSKCAALGGAVFLAAALSLGCQPPESTAVPPQEEQAPAEVAPVAEMAVEVAAAPPLPTHWTIDEPIGNGGGPTTNADLLAGPADPEKWLLYGGDYANLRHSPIDDITPANVADLEVAWAFPTGTTEQFEVSPTIYDGIMYVTTSFNRLFALNAETGEIYWRYDHPLPDRQDMKLCCGTVNRGAALSGDLVLMATLDAKMVAFHRLTGEKQWEVTLAEHDEGFSATSMPMIVKDMAVIGIAGGEFGVRGFFDAYDVATGELRWRHYTVPVEGEPGVETWAGDSWKTGGAPAWTSGAYDPEADVLYWTTGNPSPDWNGDLRAGDNLYSNSLLAVNPTPASAFGTSSSRPTTCGTTTATRSCSSSTSSATGPSPQPSCKPTATASSTSSIAPPALSSTPASTWRNSTGQRSTRTGARWWIRAPIPPRNQTTAFAPAT